MLSSKKQTSIPKSKNENKRRRSSMKICDVLVSYKRSDLNRLAKDKIANIKGGVLV
jgi:hypothetical protein